jgi:hypothetical protein
MIPYDDVVSHMTSLGQKVGEVNMAGRMNVAGQLGIPCAEKGICTGICLDWTRRVLLGHACSYTPKEDKLLAAKRSTMVNQIKRMAKGHDVWFDAEIQARHKKAEERQWMRENQKDSDQELEEFYRRSHLPNAWRTYCDVMDPILKQLRVGALKAGDVKRPFNMIELLPPANAALTGTPRIMLDSILHSRARDVSPELGENMCAMLGLCFWVRGTSNPTVHHSVAFIKLGGGFYQFIDPNYGVYVYDLHSLYVAFEYLLNDVYPADSTWGAVTHGDYVLFRVARS